jgi:hypothetical protein
MALPLSTIRRLAERARARTLAFRHKREPKPPKHRDAERRAPTPRARAG